MKNWNTSSKSSEPQFISYWSTTRLSYVNFIQLANQSDISFVPPWLKDDLGASWKVVLLRLRLLWRVLESWFLILFLYFVWTLLNEPSYINQWNSRSVFLLLKGKDFSFISLSRCFLLPPDLSYTVTKCIEELKVCMYFVWSEMYVFQSGQPHEPKPGLVLGSKAHAIGSLSFRNSSHCKRTDRSVRCCGELSQNRPCPYLTGRRFTWISGSI